MNRLAIIAAKTLKQTLVGALMFASAVLPSVQAFMPAAAWADTAALGDSFVFDAAGTGTFTVPSNVTSVTVRAWGAGGKGGDGTSISGVTYAGQGGGAGGFAAQTISVSGGQSFTYAVGQGGTAAARTGGSSSFGSAVSASGGNGGANWNEIPGNGPSVPPGPGASSACYFEGTWGYNDEGNANDFAVTCRNQRVTGICFMDSWSGPVARGFNPGNYACEGASTPASGIACQSANGTWGFNDEGSGNDIAFTCRDQRVTGVCSSNTTIPRGFNAERYDCEHGQAYTGGAPTCELNGTWAYNDEWSGNDFALSCRDWKMTGWCGSTSLARGEHGGVYTCEQPTVSNPPLPPVPPDIDPGVVHVLSAAMTAAKGALAFLAPSVAYAQEVYDGRGGQGLVGADLRAGGNAASVVAGANSLPTAGGQSPVGSYGQGGAGSASGLGADGGVGRIEVTVAGIVGGPGVDARPEGHLDGASCNAITGWAYDPDNASTSIAVHFYADGPAGTGTFLGGTTANIARPDVNAARGITGDHGFSFPTPASLKDGGNHRIYAYGINIVELFPSTNVELPSPAPVFVSGCQSGPGTNAAPSMVSVTGTTTGSVNVSYMFTATATDPEGQTVQYGFDWNNDGAIGAGEEWTAAVASGVSASRSFSWGVPGIQNFQVFARDSQGSVSPAFSFQITIAGGSSNLGFTLQNATGLSTSEPGGTANFGVVLNSAPLANVTLPVASTDTTEGTVSRTLLTFTPSTWNVVQSVVVSGVDDTILDGTISYSVVIGSSTSADINFNNLPAQTVNLVNYDDEQSGGGSTTSGGGSSSGGGSGGPCRGYGCPTVTDTSTDGGGDIVIVIDTPSSGPSTPVVSRYCLVDDFIADYARIGVENNPNEVRKIQYFLNTYEGAGLPVDGIFGTSTEAAVMAFQAKYAESVLSPWGTDVPTGIVYITTRAEMNRIFCSDNPGYREGDLSDIIDGVLYTPSNPADFEGLIGSAEATSTNIAGVFGAITQDMLDLIGLIPWYPLLVILLVLIGTAILMRGIIKDTWNRDEMLTFTQGAATLGIASVLNVLNILSYILSPDMLLAYTGVDISWLLALVLINIVAFIAVLVSVIFAIGRRISKDEPVAPAPAAAK